MDEAIRARIERRVIPVVGLGRRRIQFNPSLLIDKDQPFTPNYNTSYVTNLSVLCATCGCGFRKDSNPCHPDQFLRSFECSSRQSRSASSSDSNSNSRNMRSSSALPTCIPWCSVITTAISATVGD
jgi:hypothetical protein